MRRSTLSLFLTAATTIAAPALAAPIHGYGGLAISRAGDRIATVEGGDGGGGGSGGHGVVTLRSAADGHVLGTLDPCPTCSYSGLVFGSGDRLAFVARDRTARTATLEVAENGRTTPVATIAGLAATPRFSPDGKRIALLVTIGAAKETGATQAGVRQVGEIGETNDDQRIAVFPLGAAPLAAAAVAPVSPAGRFVYEYDWTPDGAGFVATTALGNGDNNWWVATIDRIDAATGAVTSVAKPATQVDFPRVSPDGKTVAYIGGLMSDFGSVGGDVWTVPLAGGAPTDVTRGAAMTFTSLDWTAAGLQAVALAGDRMQIVALSPGKAPASGFSQPVSLAAGDGKVAFSADGLRSATVVQDFTHAPAIYAGPALAPVQVTHDNDAAPAHVAARSISWRNEGFTVQGWLLSPLGADPAAKMPMIVAVHGGPSAASSPRYYDKGLSTAAIDAGYALFLPNPRGSYGQGEAFTAANRRDFGGGDLRDILAGVDAAERAAPIDDARLGMTGCSYGGFMAMWANTQTNRFKAIVAGAGLSNWISYYGTNGIDQWMTPFFGKTAYDDHKAYEDVSAVYHVATAHTPTFIYVGERDIEVPPTQSIEWWHALRAQGVDSSLVIYPDAGHCVPTQGADISKRSLAWFSRYLTRPAAK
ncbi:prolyl oligopeptidase family serine peptidase [Sphingomonas bacterium]|uniref:prolyl oligopeptidase family serine peptidase n=1 Tax=Sphingomonas bacterium TaxID=1895847 RepID=UPI0015758554|nr:prolyl oligopeptidase family serine peptidase [Sphingomonas bacterium]